MKVTTLQSIRLLPWLLESNPVGKKALGFKVFAFVMAMLMMSLSEDRVGLFGHEFPALDRQSAATVWVPLFLAACLATGFMHVQARPAMGLLPGLHRGTRRGSFVLATAATLLAAVVASFGEVSWVSAGALALASYGLGWSMLLGRQREAGWLWYLSAFTAALFAHDLLTWVDRAWWRAAAMAVAGAALSFFALTHGRRTRWARTNAQPRHAMGSRVGSEPRRRAAASPSLRLREADAYAWHCRGGSFPVRVAVNGAILLGGAFVMSFGVTWLFEGLDAPGGSVIQGLHEALWGRPAIDEDPDRFRFMGMRILSLLLLVPMLPVAQGISMKYLPVSRRLQSRRAIWRFARMATLCVVFLVSFGWMAAIGTWWWSGATRPSHVPGFMMILPYVLPAIPWAAALVLRCSEGVSVTPTSWHRWLFRPWAGIGIGVATGGVVLLVHEGARLALRPGGGVPWGPWSALAAIAVFLLGSVFLRTAFDRYFRQISLVPQP